MQISITVLLLGLQAKGVPIVTATPSVYEKLGVFYLGREFDLARRSCLPTPLLYDSRDLLTHAVIVGMTGSGKTGLGIGLLEEAAIDGVPALIIDPKGDLGNLLLTFPELRAGDFAPWVHGEDADRAGMSLEQFADGQANRWREGLAQWDQDGQRIARLREAAEFNIYTPGSEAGRPVSILASFSVPPPAVLQDADLLRDRVATTATSLLGLLGMTIDPLRSREHILLTNILDDAWRRGQHLELGSLIQQVQNPPFTQVGVMDLESFFPAQERFELAMMLNNLLAAPGFAAWLRGESLDVDRLLYTPSGKPQLSVFSIAHLSDAERMFFVSLLLNQTLGWMRSRPGTTSLRALLYIDEIMGYMPPVSNPPSKRPLLTLLKQARAFGLGIVLATQNPVDLDYKGLANTGTWFIGRLQTERDKRRVLEGLSGTAVVAGEGFNSGRASEILSELGQRVFLMHNVHEDAPTVFQTRWTLSYLSGPLTRQQIRQLVPSDDQLAEHPREEAAPPDAVTSRSVTARLSSTRPLVSPKIPQVFLPTRTPLRSAPLNDELQSGQWEKDSEVVGRTHPEGASRSRLPSSSSGTTQVPIVYEPQLLAVIRMHYVTTRQGLSADEDLTLLLPVGEDTLRIDWSQARQIQLTEQDLRREPEEPCRYAPVPTQFGQNRIHSQWHKSLANHLYHTRRYDLLKSSSLDEYAQPGESERDFRIRLIERAREERDRQVETLRKKYASKIRVLEDRVRRAEQAVQREAQQADSAKVDSMISIGASVLGALIGRKRLSSTELGRATSAARGLGRASRQAEQVRQAQDTLQAYERQLIELEAEVEHETQQIADRLDPLREQFQVIQLKPRRTDVDIRLLALAWSPVESVG